jgi:hypothetical protein
MTANNLKSKLNKLNVIFTQKGSIILFELNDKTYQAIVSISEEIIGYCTSNYSKFEGRTFENFNKVVKHSNR